MPSARTSVGNKEYEYKGKKEQAAKAQRAGDRRETVLGGDAAVAVALRHAIDRTPAFRACQHFSHDDFSDATGIVFWTYGRMAVQKTGSPTLSGSAAWSRRIGLGWT